MGKMLPHFTNTKYLLTAFEETDQIPSLALIEVGFCLFIPEGLLAQRTGESGFIQDLEYKFVNSGSRSWTSTCWARFAIFLPC